MSVKRFKALLFRSARIQEEIDKEQNRRWTNWGRLLKLKKIRLLIKDRLERIVRASTARRFQPARVTTTQRNPSYNH